MPLVLQGAPLIDGTGRDAHAATIVVDGERIATVSESTPAPMADAEVLDLDGLTVLPGLIDAHTHLGIVESMHMAAIPLAVIAAQMFGNAERCLLSGHTTAREVAGADGGLRQAIDMGAIPGPRLYPSGPLISQTGGHGDHWFPWLDHHHQPFFGVAGLSQPFEVANGPDEIRLAVRNAFKHGATQIKLCVSGGVVSLTDSLSDTQLTVDEMRAAVEEATARGTYVTAHCLNVRALENGLEAGLQCFEHGVGLDEKTAAKVAAAGAAIVPTLTVIELMFEMYEEWGIDPIVLPKARVVLDDAKNSLRIAHEAGVKIGSGSDELGPAQNRRGLEIALKAEIIGAMNAIVSATRTNAEIMRIDDKLGTVEEGKLADLIAIEGDPLANPRIFDDPDNVKVVIKGGEVVKDIRN